MRIRPFPATLCCTLVLSIPVVVGVAASTPHDEMFALLWMQRSAEYKASCLQVYNQARRSLDLALRDKKWTGCLEQIGQKDVEQLAPAVIVDVDETVLDNSAFNARLIQDGKRFEAKLWTAWTEEQQSLPIPGSLRFLTAATALGVRVIYITNRKHGAEEDATRGNLTRLGYPLTEAHGEDLVLTKGEVGDKSARRRSVCEKFRILAVIGDNLGDFMPTPKPRKAAPQGAATEGRITERMRDIRVDEFAAYWGVKWFVLPNPVYGSWEKVIRAQSADKRLLLRVQRDPKKPVSSGK